MPTQALLVTVRLIDGRFHGDGDWPPSPFRLFQALVAGAYGGAWRGEDRAAKDAAFRWLETLAPPLIAAPPRIALRPVTNYVPRNDLDTVGGDPRRVGEIRVAKRVRTSLFDPASPLLYAWPFDAGDDHARLLAALTWRLHTFGHGVDAAAAAADILAWDAAEQRLLRQGGLARPTASGGLVRCATKGSLDSLHARHAAFLSRFVALSGRSASHLFRQPPKPLFRGVGYDRPPARLLFDLRARDEARRFRAVPQENAVLVAAAVRDCAREHLSRAMPERTDEIARVVAGIGAGAADLARRLRIVPLPTIGFVHADPAIRRVLVEVPPDCPLAADDVAWALAGRTLPRPIDADIVAAEIATMLQHYGVDSARAARWRTVTPAALPFGRPHSRLSGVSRDRADAEATTSTQDALRHAGLDPRGVLIRTQREPWNARGARAEAFKADRFGVGRLRHVELVFPAPIQGPLVIGDGRWLGLGVMRPVSDMPPALHAFSLRSESGPMPGIAEAARVAQALRRAVMARVAVGNKRPTALPPFFTGHAANGEPLRNGSHAHLFFAAEDADGDGRLDRVMVVAPHLADRTVPASERDLAVLAASMIGFTTLRGGSPGPLHLLRLPAEDALKRAQTWRSHTPYRPTRHPNGNPDLRSFVAADLLAECSRRGLPRPEVAIDATKIGPRDGITATATLRFLRMVEGPLMLGRGSHTGAGLFLAEV